MLQSFVIMLREGFEVFLIVAIALAFLRKSGRERLVPALYWGVMTAIAVSILAGYLLWRANNQPLWEGILSFSTAMLVGTWTIYMWHAGKTLKRDIEKRLDAASSETSNLIAFIGVFLFTVLMITREGMETALMLGVLVFQVKSVPMLAGSLIGLGTSLLVAVLWAYFGHRINLKRFFQVTAIFLLVFGFQLFLYGIHELAEANLLPSSQTIHDLTEPYGPAGVYGHLLTYALVGLPLAWMIIPWLIGRIKLVLPSQGHLNSVNIGKQEAHKFSK